MLVSVVCPAFNEEDYIARCLEALAKQEHPGFDYEVIVVDDGSTDRTAEIARNSGVRVVCGLHRGVSAARQTGFEAARGEIIASTDADSEPPRDWLVRLVSAFAGNPDTIGVHGPFQYHDGRRFAGYITRYLGGVFFFLNNAFGTPTFSGQNFAVRSEAWMRVGGFDPAWQSCEDSLFSLKLASIGRIQFCGDIVMPTSSRRIQEGYWNILKRAVLNHVRVTWTQEPPLPFPNIR